MSASKPTLTQARLKEIFSYDPETGAFTRLIWTGGNARPGDSKKNTAKCGSIYFDVDGKRYLAHRLAWLYVYGQMPSTGIDHKDGVKTNNRIENLRPANQVENGQNRHSSNKNSKSRLLG